MRVRARVATVGAALVVAVAVACGGGADVEPQTFFVQVGAEDLSQSVQFNAFLPDNLTINAGDTIVFTKQTAEQHTVTFNVPGQQIPDFNRFTDGETVIVEANPNFFRPAPLPDTLPPFGARINSSVTLEGRGFLNSGSMETTDDVFRVTFAKEGAYPYVCLLHPRAMTGTIVVNEVGTAYPKTQEQYEQDSTATVAALQASSRVVLTRAQLGVLPPRELENGGREFTVFAGTGDTEVGLEFNRYIGGENLTVKAGDTVTWTWEQDTPFRPHTVTFLPPTVELPPVIVEVPTGDGPPRMFVNPIVERPTHTGVAVYDGASYFNSGILIKGGPTLQTYSLRFSTPGTYKYLCLIHDGTGMNGTITVVE
ncbi:MAG: plastocyanin/azurin family copper-binding protein [Chloroflexi bacterium]|nr:plastocyanin/azurin family copper-binding protein [Chloroflexota bacterium]